MNKIIVSALKWGVIGGLAIILLQTIFLLISDSMMGGGWSFVVYLPLIFMMIWGGISIRKDNEGGMSYGQAFLAVATIAAVGTLMYNIYMYRVWMKIIDPNYMNRVWTIVETKMREQAEKRGTSDADVDKQIEFVKKLNFELIAYGISAVCTLVFSLIIAAFVKRPEQKPLTPSE